MRQRQRIHAHNERLTLEADYGYHERRWQRDAKGFQDVAPFLESVHDRPFAMHEADDDHERVARGAADPVRMIGGLAVADMIYTEMQTESKYQAADDNQRPNRPFYVGREWNSSISKSKFGA